MSIFFLLFLTFEDKKISRLTFFYFQVLVAWRAYAEMRKHKKARMLAAASAYRDQLIRSACSQWLATADSLSHFRSRMAAQHQAKAVVDSFNLVHRIALHWKIWAKTRTAARRKRIGSQTGVINSGAGPSAATSFSYAYPPLMSSLRLTSAPPSSQLSIASQVYPGISRREGESVATKGQFSKDNGSHHRSQPLPQRVAVSPAQARVIQSARFAVFLFFPCIFL